MIDGVEPPPLDFSENGGPISFGYVILFAHKSALDPIEVLVDDFEVSAFCTPPE